MIIDNELLNEISRRATESERLRMNYNLHDSLDAKAQRLLNALEPGTILPIHRHRHTAETYILLRGRIDVIFYSDDATIVSRHELDPEQLWRTYSCGTVAYGRSTYIIHNIRS